MDEQNARKAGEDFVARLDLSQVEEADREMVSVIMEGVATFHIPVPKLEVDIIALYDHYEITVRGWTQRIDDIDWYEMFVAPTRPTEYRSVTETETLCHPQPIKFIQIQKKGFPVSKQRTAADVAGEVEEQNARMTNTRFTQELDLSHVENSDRDTVSRIRGGIVTFHHPMPQVVVKLIPLDDHYNMTIRNWSRRINDRNWYHKFLSNRRPTAYDGIIKTETVCHPEPMKFIQIRKRTFAASKKRK